ncbi:hypothetical protein IV203_016747 [Nitzschia inconspicua]|uniref:Uncharacterized protein n=1 Tax=Nitzschia inconspicua TaxID=303405 RepID=A0A9K3PHN2_9STRA|nr:hypothetical protein IV203_016747 [Nitzschia inconspicua]
MMSIQNRGSFDHAMINDHQQQQDLVQLARDLRRMKRRLLLEHAGVPLPASLMEHKMNSPGMVRSRSDSTEVAAVSCSSSPVSSWSSTSPIRAAMLRPSLQDSEPESPSTSRASIE